jgi:hypothetical protein
MAARWFPWIIYILIAGACAMLVPDQMAAVWRWFSRDRESRLWERVERIVGLVELISFGVLCAIGAMLVTKDIHRFIEARWFFTASLCFLALRMLAGAYGNLRGILKWLAVAGVYGVIIWGLIFLLGIADAAQREYEADQNERDAAKVNQAMAEHPHEKLPQKRTAHIARPLGVPAALPPLRKIDSFSTYVLYNPTNEHHPLVCASSYDRMRTFVCIELREIATRRKFDGSIQQVGEIVQHYFPTLILEATTTGSFAGAGGHPIIADEMPPTTVPDMNRDPVAQVMPNLSDNDRKLLPWSLNDGEHLDITYIKLPKDALLSFLVMSSPEWETAHGTYILRIERKGYYRVDLHATPVQEYEPGSIPENYTLTALVPASQVIAYRLKIELDCTIQRANPDHEFVPSDYEQWVKDVFAHIRKRLEN